MIQYRRSYEFASGSDPIAEQFTYLANAINDRLSQGVGDPCQRIHAYIFGLTRQLRNSGDTGVNFPPSYEWQSTAQYLDPNVYPLPDSAPAGDPAGANIANPANAFVFGSTAMNMLGEGDRLSIREVTPGVYEGILLELPNNPTEYDKWVNQKYNRGGIDPITGNYTSPAFDASISGDMYPDVWTFYLKSYGGYLPVPELNPIPCYQIGGGAKPNKYLKLTNKETAAVITFDGTCDPATTTNCGVHFDCTNHVQGIYQSTYYYYVVFYNGTIQQYDKRIWMEGPYTAGGELKRPFGDQITSMMISPYIATFRGSKEQRSGSCIDIESMAFDNQYFFTHQYQLSPAYATSSGTNLVIEYPTASIVGPINSGSISTYICHEGFVLGGYYLSGSGLQDTASLLFIGNNKTFSASVVTEDTNTFDIDNDIANIYLSRSLVAGEQIYLELSELMKAKPELKDAYLVLRTSTANDTIPANQPDNIGYNYISSKEAFDNYKKYGGIINQHGSIAVRQDTQYANVNPTWQSANDLIDKWTKIINETSLEKYEVSGSLSVLHFKKRYPSSGVMINPWTSMLDSENTSSNCIRNTASISGWSNEWLMHLSLKPWSHSNTSIWNDVVYGSYYNNVTRQHVLCRDMDPDMFVHFQSTPHTSNGADNIPISTLYDGEMYSPEGLSAYNYDRCNIINYNSYTEEDRIRFFKSCQVYPKDYTIHDLRVYQEGGEEYIKMTLNSRLQSHPAAATSYSTDVTTWDNNNLNFDQDYRTDENGIMQWLIWKKLGLIPQAIKTGDTSWNANPTMFEVLKGSIYPTFYFTKLIPKPYIKQPRDTDHTDKDKTLMTMDQPLQAYLYIRGMCEGFIDGKAPNGCVIGATTTAYDYQWENLCYDAFGNTWFNFLEEERPDKPQLGAALPNTRYYSKFMTNLSKCINLLYRARLAVPWYLEARNHLYKGEAWVDITWGNCSTNDGVYVIDNVNIPTTPTFVSSTAWAEASTMVSIAGCEWKGEIHPTIYNRIKIISSRTTAEYRFQLTEPNFIYALPPDVYNLFISGQNGFYGKLTTTNISNELYTVATSEESYIRCGFPYYGTLPNNQPGGYNINVITTNTDECVYQGNGVLDAGYPKVPGDALGSLRICNYTDYDNNFSNTSLTLGPTNVDTMFLTVPIIG